MSDIALLGDEVEMLIPCLDPNFRGDRDDFFIRKCDDNAKLLDLKSGEQDSNALAEAAPQFQEFYPSQRILELLVERAS